MKPALHHESQGEGEALVLLHGFTGSGADWQHVFAQPFPDHRFIIPDLIGHGRSPLEGAFTFRRAADEVLRLLDELKIERFKAIGMSGGAQALLHMATKQPERVDSMVLVSTAPYFPAAARSIMAHMTVEGQSEADWQMMRERHHLGDDQIRKLWQTGHELKDSYEDVNFTPPMLGRISARTLIVHGDRDPLYPVSIAMEMHQAIAGSHLWIVPNGGHGPIFGDQAPAFVATAEAFFSNTWA